MTRTRSLLVLLASCALTLVAPLPASADLFRNKRFVFGPRINHGDPVNLLWFGGHVTVGACGGVKDANCVVRGFTYWDGMAIRFCNGSNDGQVRMLLEGGGKSSPHNDTEVSGSITCKKQYHARIWDDSAHGEPTRRWAIAPIHHENRPAFAPGHTIDRPWEIAEFDAVDNLNRAGGFCTHRDWRPLPGSGGKIKANKKQNGYSDGYISRISFQQGSCPGG
jgi:prepilin-type processing-associated H-X9-DG protein